MSKETDRHKNLSLINARNNTSFPKKPFSFLFFSLSFTFSFYLSAFICGDLTSLLLVGKEWEESAAHGDDDDDVVSGPCILFQQFSGTHSPSLSVTVVNFTGVRETRTTGRTNATFPARRLKFVRTTRRLDPAAGLMEVRCWNAPRLAVEERGDGTLNLRDASVKHTMGISLRWGPP